MLDKQLMENNVYQQYITNITADSTMSDFTQICRIPCQT